MNKILMPVLTLFFMLTTSAAEASWLIDIEKFINSVHGENSCQECHENISGKTLHPDPADVNKKLSAFFSADQCLMCHDGITDKLKEGSHGTKPIADIKKYEDCIACHDPHFQQKIKAAASQKLPADLSAFSAEDQACLTCHRSVDVNNPEEKKRLTQLCFGCHAQSGTQIQKISAQTIALIDRIDYQSVPHAETACLICHPQAPGFGHGRQTPADCRQCHRPHAEKTAHDAHVGVACQACHLQNIQPVRDPETKLVLWKTTRNLNAPLNIHAMIDGSQMSHCRRCHTRGNRIGAAAMVLPAKSVMCMPCHTATFSIGDTPTILAIVIFLSGLVLTFSYVLTGSIPESVTAGPARKFLIVFANGIKTVFSANAASIFRSLMMDVLLQRRLYNRSVTRWLIHSLIFLPFLLRFLWGIAALLVSTLKPEWQSVWFMLDKNHPVTAFLFDLTGIMILGGVVLAFIRGAKQTDRPAGLPNQDRLALALIGSIILIGFVLEGMRMAMTAWPGSAASAFVGYGISKLFAGASALNQLYGYIWYLHAIFAGAFLAYLPFSRLAHIIMAPFVLAMNAVKTSRHEKKH